MNKKMDNTNFSPLIHIGFHKTATTFLQNNIFSNPEYGFIPLSDRKFREAELARPSKTIHVKGFAAYFLTKSNQGYFLNPYENRTKEIHQEVEYFMQETDYIKDKTCVLSNERLCGSPHIGFYDSKDICNRIFDAFPNAKILITVREQRSMIKSLYFQYMVAGGTKRIEKFLSQKYSNFGGSSFRPSDLCYDKLVGHYIKKFGKSNVQVLPYEMLKNNNELFFDRLFSFIEKEKPALDISKHKKENNSKSMYVRYKMRSLFRLFNPYKDVESIIPSEFLFNALGVLSIYVSKILPQYLNRSFKNRIDKDIDNFSKHKFSESNKKLEEQIEINLNDYGYDL
ncbi:sulfotransferase domain-containing protein [Gammaproteobacteria bacterium]|nr:sulfotransferase domain-containing protein [Gammaproteobacteria bacterium]MDC0064471.1 sulfotransferase domain-containing protein [Gammaproteobacteria bacterium]